MQAIFWKGQRVLEFWSQKNVKEMKACESLKQAKSILSKCLIKQELIVK